MEGGEGGGGTGERGGGRGGRGFTCPLRFLMCAKANVVGTYTRTCKPKLLQLSIRLIIPLLISLRVFEFMGYSHPHANTVKQYEINIHSAAEKEPGTVQTMPSNRLKIVAGSLVNYIKSPVLIKRVFARPRQCFPSPLRSLQSSLQSALKISAQLSDNQVRQLSLNNKPNHDSSLIIFKLFTARKVIGDSFLATNKHQ